MIDLIRERSTTGFYNQYPLHYSVDALNLLHETGGADEFELDYFEGWRRMGELSLKALEDNGPEENMAHREKMEQVAPDLFKAAYSAVYGELEAIGRKDLEREKFDRDKELFFHGWGINDEEKQARVLEQMEQGNANVIMRITENTEPEREKVRKAREDFMRELGMKIDGTTGYLHSASGLPISPKNVFEVSVVLARNKVKPNRFYATGGRHTYITAPRIREFITLMKRRDVPFKRVLESAPQASAHLDNVSAVIDMLEETGGRRILNTAPEIVAYEPELIQRRLDHLASYGVSMAALNKAPRLILNRRETITAKALPYFDTTDTLGIPRDIAAAALEKFPSFLETGVQKGRVIQRIVKSYIPKEAIHGYVFADGPGEAGESGMDTDTVGKFASMLDKLQKCPTERLLDVVEQSILKAEVNDCSKLLSEIVRSKAKADPHKPLDIKTATLRWPRIADTRHGAMLLSSYLATTTSSSRSRKGRPVTFSV